MNHFQSQYGWENDNHSNHKNQNKKFPRVIQISRKAIRLIITLLILFLVAIFSVYLFGRSIEGVWIRQEDDNAYATGMMVEVSRKKGIWQGEIIAMGTDTNMFSVGQIKWNDIKKTGFGQYECNDLIGKTGNNDNHYDGTISYIVVSNNGKQLSFTNYSDKVGTGKHQIWIKQG